MIFAVAIECRPVIDAQRGVPTMNAGVEQATKLGLDTSYSGIGRRR